MKNSHSHISCKPKAFLNSGVKLFWLLAFVLGGNWGWGQIITIGSGTFNSFDVPIKIDGEYSYAQMIYSASQINAQGVTGSQNITAIQFSYAGATHGGVANNWNLYLGNTTKTNFTSTTDWVGVSNLTQVYSGSVSVPSCGCASTSQWYTVTFSTPFLWDGTSNLVIAVQETNSGNNNPIGHDYTSSSPTNVSITRANSSLITPSSPGTGTRSTMLPNIKITFSPACSAPTSVSANVTTTPICEGSSIALQGTATGASNWSWLGPNGFSSTIEDPSINLATTAASGTYFLTAQNSCGTGSGLFDNFSDNNFTSNPVWTPQPNPFSSGTPTTWTTGVANLQGSTTAWTQEVISTPSTQTNGSWKFDFTMAALNNFNEVLSFFFISNNAALNGGQGYYVSIRGNTNLASSTIYLRRYNGTVNQGADASNISLGSYTWPSPNTGSNTLIVTRSLSGIFNVYLNGSIIITSTPDLTYSTSTHAGFWSYSNANNTNHIVDNIICSSTMVDVTVNPTITTPTFSLGATSTRCQIAGTVTYTATSTTSTGITYSLDATSIAGGVTINSATGDVTYPLAWSGTTVITASAAGCSGPLTATHTVSTSPKIIWANTQSPASGVSCSNDNFIVYGQVYIPGVTDNTNQGANVTAQLGYSTTNTDPSTWTNWVNATYNSAVTGNNDEYMGTLSGLAGNTYYYAFRYSYNGCAYVYGGYSAPSAASNIWTINTGGGGAFVGNSTTNGGGSTGINSSNNLAFGLYNNSTSTSEAIRNFPSLLVGQTVRFDMDNGWLNSGSVGVGLQNASGQNVWEIFFAGGATGYSINGSLLSPTVPFTANGLRITFTLLTSTTYSATIQILNGGATYGPYTGTLQSPGSGQSITRFRAFNYNAGSGANYDFYFNNIVTPSFFDNASTYSSLSNGLQSATSVGGIWNNPTIYNGTLTVTTSPTTSNAGATQTICEGATATLAANAPSDGTGAWSISSGPNNDIAQFNNASSNLAVFTPTAAGNYTLVWTITNGSCTSTSNVIITVTSGILNFVNTQFPGSAAICVGQSANVYGQVFEPGVTPNAGQGANIEVQVGYVNSSNTDPPNSNSWTNWSNATYNTAVTGNNDEYIGTFGSALSAGTYYYAFRYRLNGCAWQYGGYSIGGGGTWDGTNNINGILTIYSNTATSMTPSSICAGVSNITVTGSNAGSYELLINNVSQGVPSAINSWTIPGPLVANDQVCVRGYAATNLITMDGAFNEAFWSPALVNSAGGATSAQNRINALYVKNAHGFLNIGIAGRLVYGEDRKILLFVDSKTGVGYNNLSSWSPRDQAPNNGMKNLKGDVGAAIQFDPGFNPDFIISIGTNSSGVSFLDFYNMVANTNNYLGSTITQPTRIAYQANINATDYTKGYEIRIPINLFGTINSPMKFFTMLTNNPTDNSATTLSNQFLSAASSGEVDYGDGPVNFGNAAPNPVSYVLESDCYTDTCRTVVAPTIPTFSPIASICSGTSLSALPTTSTNSPSISGTWSPALNNTATTLYTFTPTAGQCANTTNMTISIFANPALIFLSPP